jgi:hypothetical protein
VNTNKIIELPLQLISDDSSETAVGVHGFSVFFSWQFHYDKTAATAGRR